MLALLPLLVMISLTEVQTTVESYARAASEFDYVKMEKLMAPDYLEVSPLGEVDHHDEVLSFYKVPVEKRGPHPTSIEFKDWNIRMLGDSSAVAIFEEDIHLGPTLMRFRVTSTLMKAPAGWLLVSNHVCGIRQKRK